MYREHELTLGLHIPLENFQSSTPQWKDRFPPAVDIGSTLNIAAFNVGIAIEAFVGGTYCRLHWVDSYSLDWLSHGSWSGTSYDMEIIFGKMQPDIMELSNVQS